MNGVVASVMIVNVDRLDIGLTLALPSRLLPTTKSSLENITNERLNKGMFNSQSWEAEGIFITSSGQILSLLGRFS